MPKHSFKMKPASLTLPNLTKGKWFNLTLFMAPILKCNFFSISIEILFNLNCWKYRELKWKKGQTDRRVAFMLRINWSPFGLEALNCTQKSFR